tara:strand:+ start:2001 stop:2390 length:390 start_codon:yes stop_codon:yes gene_type:complete
MASKPEKETKEALNPYTEMREIKNEIIAIANNRKTKNGFKNKMVAVMVLVKAMLIRIAFILRFLLPGISPDEFKSTPTATAGANSEYPTKYKIAKGIAMAVPNLIPRSKSVFFRNSFNSLSLFFNVLCN